MNDVGDSVGSRSFTLTSAPRTVDREANAAKPWRTWQTDAVEPAGVVILPVLSLLSIQPSGQPSARLPVIFVPPLLDRVAPSSSSKEPRPLSRPPSRVQDLKCVFAAGGGDDGRDSRFGDPSANARARRPPHQVSVAAVVYDDHSHLDVCLDRCPPRCPPRSTSPSMSASINVCLDVRLDRCRPRTWPPRRIGAPTRPSRRQRSPRGRAHNPPPQRVTLRARGGEGRRFDRRKQGLRKRQARSSMTLGVE